MKKLLLLALFCSGIAHATTQLYVSTTGSDSNNGLTSGAPFATLQHSGDVARTVSDTVVINNASSSGATFSAGVSEVGPILNVITFLTTIPVTVQGTRCFEALEQARFTISGPFSMECSLYGINAEHGARIIFSGVNFGSMPSGYHIRSHDTASVEENGSNTISGGAIEHLRVSFGGGLLWNGCIETFTNNVTFSDVFAYTSMSGSRISSASNNSWNLNGYTVTGSQYLVQMNGTINMFGTSATSLPGSSAGVVRTGGQFVIP